MKNWRKLVLGVMVGIILLLPGDVNAATSISFSDMTVKNVFLIISIVVILLLLYLGYRVDSSESIPKEKKSSKKEFIDSKDNYVKKQPVDTYIPNDNVYEEDSRAYEVDNVNPEEISESIEYEEDNFSYQPEEDFEDDNVVSQPEEDDFEDIDTILSNIEPEKSLYEVASNDLGKTISFDSSLLNKELNTVSDIEEIVEDEDFGEEFDTSIIDNIDDDFEDIKTSSFTNKIAESVVEEESDFQGFSVRTPKGENAIVNDFKNTFDEIDELEDLEHIQEIEEITIIEKPKKRYTKVSTKKVEPVVLTELEEDFMRQMEVNLGDGDFEESKLVKKKSTRKKKTE